MVVAVTAPPLTNSRANHKARLLLSPVFGESVGLAVPFVPVPALGLAVERDCSCAAPDAVSACGAEIADIEGF